MLKELADILQNYLYRQMDPKLRDRAVKVYYDRYDFSVGRFTCGYQQFFYKGVNLESIGSFTSLSKKITLTGMNHPTKYITTNAILYYKSWNIVDNDRPDLVDESKNRRIKIGNDVWIGDNVTILPSVTVGDGAVIGAGSVVVKDVPPYAFVAGVPARVLKYRFSPEEIDLLLKCKWWNWSLDKIKDNIDLLTNMSRFFQYCQNME